MTGPVLRVATVLIALAWSAAEVGAATRLEAEPHRASIVLGRSIEGVRTGMTVEAVRARLGRPDRIARARPRFRRDAPVVRYHYLCKGLAVDFRAGQGYVWRVSTTNPRFRTHSGIRVGLGQHAMRRRLRDESCKVAGGFGYCVRDEEGDPTFVYLRAGRVSSIAIQVVLGDY
jgi:hypothetical protein